MAVLETESKDREFKLNNRKEEVFRAISELEEVETKIRNMKSEHKEFIGDINIIVLDQESNIQ